MIVVETQYTCRPPATSRIECVIARFAVSITGTATSSRRVGNSGRSPMVSADRNVMTRKPVSTPGGTVT